MGFIYYPDRVCLIVGLLYTDVAVYHEALTVLIKEFGTLNKESLSFPFKHTTYYNDELGDGITRMYCVFDKDIDKDSLATVKCKTNEIEESFSRDGKRRINIDPGYIDLSKLVLASTKDFAHRIYVRDGIYAEVTLMFQKGTFLPLPWTYPDYKEERTISFFNAVRNKYYRALNNHKERKDTNA